MTGDEPAFPGVRGDDGFCEQTYSLGPNGDSRCTWHNQGMSLRQYYAGLAMAAAMGSSTVLTAINQELKAIGVNHPYPECWNVMATYAVEVADALIAELGKERT
jgi:hypothetical protein